MTTFAEPHSAGKTNKVNERCRRDYVQLNMAVSDKKAELNPESAGAHLIDDKSNKKRAHIPWWRQKGRRQTSTTIGERRARLRKMESKAITTGGISNWCKSWNPDGRSYRQWKYRRTMGEDRTTQTMPRRRQRRTSCRGGGNAAGWQ